MFMNVAAKMGEQRTGGMRGGAFAGACRCCRRRQVQVVGAGKGRYAKRMRRLPRAGERWRARLVYGEIRGT